MNEETRERMFTFEMRIPLAAIDLAEVATGRSPSVHDDAIDVDAVAIDDLDRCRDCDPPEGMDW
jgi:hypothetical protein